MAAIGEDSSGQEMKKKHAVGKDRRRGGSSGTADVACMRARLRQISASHSEGDLLVAVAAIRRALWALESLSSAFAVEVSLSGLDHPLAPC